MQDDSVPGQPKKRKNKSPTPKAEKQEDDYSKKKEVVARPGEVERFFTNSRKALKKTAGSFICLAVLMILSFIISTYEYNHVHQQYDQAIK